MSAEKEPPVATVDRAHTQFHNENALVKPALLVGGTMVARDLARSRRFYEEFCGLEVVRHKPNALLLRDSTHRRTQLYWYIEIYQRDAIDRPQHVLNHWGIDLPDAAAVDRCHALTLEHQETFRIKKVQRVQVQHGAYAFYICDLDDNWWEFEAYRGPRVTTPNQTDLVPTYTPTRFQVGEPHH
jgi:catechol 2,3-dioxygenase-like lactoylglutathione lyase family enzyme